MNNTSNEKKQPINCNCFCDISYQRDVIVDSIWSEFRHWMLVSPNNIHECDVLNFYIAAYVGCEVCCEKFIDRALFRGIHSGFTPAVVWNVLRIAATKRHFKMIFALFRVDPSKVSQCTIPRNKKDKSPPANSVCRGCVLSGQVDASRSCNNDSIIKSEWLEEIAPFLEWISDSYFPPEYYAACNGCAYHFLKHDILSAKKFFLSIRIALTLGHINFVTSICFVSPISLSEVSILRQQNANIANSNIAMPGEEKVADVERFANDVVILNLNNVLLDYYYQSDNAYVSRHTGFGIQVSPKSNKSDELHKIWIKKESTITDMFKVIISKGLVDFTSFVRKNSPDDIVGRPLNMKPWDDTNSKLVYHPSENSKFDAVFKTSAATDCDITVTITNLGDKPVFGCYSNLTRLVSYCVTNDIPLSDVSVTLSYPKRDVKI